MICLRNQIYNRKISLEPLVKWSGYGAYGHFFRQAAMPQTILGTRCGKKLWQGIFKSQAGSASDIRQTKKHVGYPEQWLQQKAFGLPKLACPNQTTDLIGRPRPRVRRGRFFPI